MSSDPFPPAGDGHRAARPFPLAIVLLSTAVLSAPSPVPAAHAPAVQDDLELETTRRIEFTAREGTWMNLDVSPDGTTLVFDLLGDIYSLPLDGGVATRLTEGPAYDIQPTFSPDGGRIAFVSDRSGSDELWSMAPDGSDPRALTDEPDKGVTTPEWTPDGEYLVARRDGDLWLYHRAGGSGVALSDDDLAEGAYGPRPSPDGRHVFFSSRAGNRLRRVGLTRINAWQVRRLDRLTGDIVTVTASPNGAFRPTLSPDGSHLVYGARVDARTGLRIRDLRTHRERWLLWDIDRDLAERPGTLDLLPRFDFTPDGGAVIIATGGTFQHVSITDGEVREIPFEARVSQRLGPLIHFERRVEEGRVRVRNIRYANADPPAERLVFSALAQLWGKRLPGGEPTPLVQQDAGQFQPVLSPDGSRLAWVTWNDVDGGHLWAAELDGLTLGTPTRLTHDPGYYLHPAWSPDGERIAFLQEDAAAFRNIWSRNTGRIVWVDAGGGPLHEVASAPSDNRLSFSPDGDRIRYVADVSPGSFDGERPAESELVSVRLDGTDRRLLARIEAATWEAVPSPDGGWVAFTVREDLFVAALPLTGSVPVIGEKRGPGPVRRVTREGGIDVHWENDSRTLAWTFADTFYRIDLETLLAASDEEGSGAGDPGDDPMDADGKAAEGENEPRARPEAYPIELSAPRHTPRGTLALVGATVIPMSGIEPAPLADATVLIRDHRIAAVGPRDAVEIPTDAEIMDVSGQWIIPGLIDLHAHLRPPREVFVESSWAYLANLAYGVTTTRDVSTSNDSFAYAELVETGHMIGPRIYSTGRAMTPGNARIESLEDARAAVRHYERLGTDVIKQYMQPHRRQRQWVARAARERGLNVTNEGGGDLRLDLTQVLDGFTGVEHNLPVAPIYDDVVQLVARSRTWYTPTLVVSYGGPTAEWYFYQGTQVHDDPKLARFTPHDDLDRRTRRGLWHHPEEWHFDDVAAGAAAILEAGGNVGLGGHGEQQGICAHWELWALQMGGLDEWDALRTATSVAAAGLGRSADLGTVEAGKLADLVVLEADPLTDIRHSTAIRWVVKNGEVFDGDTLEATWPERRERPPLGYRNVGAPPQEER